MRKILAVASRKGGVGKTTTAVQLAGWAARKLGRTLFIDLDPKADATSAWLGMAEAHGPEPGATIYHVLVERDVLPDDVIRRVPLKEHRKDSILTIDVIRSHASLEAANVQLMSMLGRELKLRNWLRQVEDRYDFVIIDTPGDSASLLTLNALMAADEVLIPTEAEPYSLVGMQYLLKNIQGINEARQAISDSVLGLAGILLVQYDGEYRIQRDAYAALKQQFPDNLLPTVPRRAVVPNSAGAGMDIFGYENGNPSDIGLLYARIAEEVLLS